MNRDFVYNYLSKRVAALNREDQEKLRDEIFELKKKAAARLPELVEKAKNKLEQAGAKVYVVKDNAAATELIKELAGSSLAVKSKSNTLDKLGLKGILGDKLTETDLGAYIVSQIGGDSDHPVLPAIDLSAEEIVAKFKERGIDLPAKPKELVDKLKKIIKEKILSAEVGLTGANAVTADGQIMLLENEGNISLVTRLPGLHIAVAKVEKVVASYEDAIKIAKAAAVWGTGQSWTSYVSFIGGPSQTADIENELVTGVQGAQKLILILIEGQSYQKIGTELESMLYCIHCGACYNLCPSWNLTLTMPKVSSDQTNFTCTLCQNCTLNCPARIDWQNITRIYREKFTAEGKISAVNAKMLKNLRQYGNPFGEVSEGVAPDELFCC
ncbi:MAG: LUD domain-containing protein [Patescibacteria group bacterium]|jgi:L-lactate utilization protein LutB